ncbi:hypothetical protein [Mucilaginibacter sp.]|uniref:hypothetical protein n=1 Tax=Mucilaginibacter sp. TaxID=1882438 RepID=UPI00284F9A06|nr:hypothetical protein [Mucilaginibacter sp.]MDR3697745.1 hypothetical protein [Mucilaginibacter sp.]
MSKSSHNLQSEKVIAYLEHIGFSASIQQRIGAFAVIWGLFESNLENVLWLLKNENVEGVKPTTEGKPAGHLIDELSQLSGILSIEAHKILAVACSAAKELADYRHAIMHGTMLSLGGSVSFIRNPQWRGNLRKKPTHDAHVNENLLDIAIDCAGVLSNILLAIQIEKTAAPISTAIEARWSDVQRCRSQANELRHLTDLINDERY